MSTQWDYSPMGSRVCIKYPSCFAVMSEMGVPADERRALFLDLRVIEGAVLEQQSDDTSE